MWGWRGGGQAVAHGTHVFHGGLMPRGATMSGLYVSVSTGSGTTTTFSAGTPLAM